MPSLRQRINAFRDPLGERSLFSALTTAPPDIGRRALLPGWYFQAPYGQPRMINVVNIRELAKQPFVHMCIKTIVDDFATTPWDIVPKDPHKFNEKHIDTEKEFCMNPNKNKETLPDLMRQWAYDVLSLDAGVFVKVFSNESYLDVLPEDMPLTARRTFYDKGKMKGKLKKEVKVKLTDIKKAWHPLKPRGKRKLLEVYCRDGSTFLADGDYTGFVHRWYQYSFKLPRRDPQLFDRDEIVYTMMSPRSYQFYGWSPIQSLEDVIKTVKEMIIYHLTMFEEKGVPDGLISVLDISKTELKRLRDYWKKEIKGKRHKFGVIGREAKFTPITITSRDMEMIASQQWFVKLVMATFSINIPILSLRGEAPRAGTWALLRRERQKAVLPLLQMFENEWNAEVLSEFGFDDVEFKFQTYDLEEDKIKREMDRLDIGSGILTINEVRETKRGLTPVDWGSEPFSLPAHALRTGGFPMTQFPKSLEKKPTLDEFKEVLAKVI